ncbi:hypothetical protein [Paenibacillus lactis]|uniref:hypothetical protein n=1 Tax=Paenibacillus lactis TaxID=228574 RepID=UPI003D74579A
MKKPMSEKQRKAIEGVEKALGIKYSGEPTAQGAFLFLRDHIEDAQKEVNRRINEERRHMNLLLSSNPPVFTDNQILDQMAFYRYDDAEYQLGNEDESFAETPTSESLQMESIRWSMLL